MIRVCAVVVAVLAQGFCVGVRADESDFNVDFFCGWGGCYRPMEWTPVEIGIQTTLEEPFNGAIVLSAPQDGLNNLNISHQFVLTKDLYLHLPLVTKFAFAADRCDVQLFKVVNGEFRKRVYAEQRDLWGGSSSGQLLQSITENDMLIGHIGGRRFGLLRLPKQAVSRSRRGEGKVYLGDKLIRMAPWDWAGLVSLDILILYDPDWDQFNPRQLEAISQWVLNGGKVLLVLGVHPLAGNNPISEVIPVHVGQARQTTLGVELLGDWDLQSSDPETIVFWPLAEKPGVQLCARQFSDANDCVFATGYAGFGRVGVLAFDPATLSEGQGARSSRFWVKCLGMVLDDICGDGPAGAASTSRRQYAKSYRSIRFEQDAENSINSRQNTNYFETGVAQAANNAVMNYIYKGIRPLSIWWVILLLSLLAVLLGPVDYIILKRLGRLPLTWVTCTFWIITFTVFAYYGVRFLRSGDLELRVVSILDGVADGKTAWSTNYCGLFAPRSAEYRLKDLGEKQWWSGIAPMEQSIWAHRYEVGARTIYCNQEDGENWPVSLPVNIWTIQCLMNEGVIERLPFTADVGRDGDQVTVQINNESDAAILKGYVLFDDGRGVFVGTVGPHSSGQYSMEMQQVNAWREVDENRLRDSYYSYQHYSEDAGRLNREYSYFAQGSLQRTRAIDAYLAHGAAVVCVEYENAAVPFAVDARRCKYEHIQLGRLVVFPGEEDGEFEK